MEELVHEVKKPKTKRLRYKRSETAIFGKEESNPIEVKPVKRRLVRQEEMVVTKKAPLPFTGLTSFQSTAIMLSYLGYADQNDRLLECMSKKSRFFHQNHHEILSAFYI